MLLVENTPVTKATGSHTFYLFSTINKHVSLFSVSFVQFGSLYPVVGLV